MVIVINDEVIEVSPTTGVINNSSPEWLHEDMWTGTELTYLEYIAEGGDPEEWESVGSETTLIGFIECEPSDEDAFYHVKSHVDDVDDIWLKIDPEAEYSAIVSEIYAQIVKSKWVQFVRGCSPCYPFQGDLDSEAEYEEGLPPITQGIVNQGYGWAYTLPPGVWGDRKPRDIYELRYDWEVLSDEQL